MSQTPAIEQPTERQIAVRRRVSALWDQHAEVFFAVVRDADRRQREDGDDQLTALEKALDQADAQLAGPAGAVEPDPLPTAAPSASTRSAPKRAPAKRAAAKQGTSKAAGATVTARSRRRSAPE